MNRVKVPRASIACTIINDPDYIELVATHQGREAFGLFVALLALAKDRDECGYIRISDAVAASMVRWPLDSFQDAIKMLLEMPGRWLIRHDAQTLEIRSFTKWSNGWGGRRPGAGRPPDDIQDEIKNNSSGPLDSHLKDAPASASASAPCSPNGEQKDKEGAASPLSVQVSGQTSPKTTNTRTRGPNMPVPTLEQVRDYGATINLPAGDCEHFHDYQTAKGWRVGNGPMRDWKAALRTWKRNAGKFANGGKPNDGRMTMAEHLAQREKEAS